MKHTPGPWKLDHDSYHNSVALSGGDIPVIALVHAKHENWEGDLNLIASAPELYFASAMVADISDTKIDTLSHNQLKNLVIDMRGEARAAIKKAEGRK